MPPHHFSPFKDVIFDSYLLSAQHDNVKNAARKNRRSVFLECIALLLKVLFEYVYKDTFYGWNIVLFRFCRIKIIMKEYLCIITKKRGIQRM